VQDQIQRYFIYFGNRIWSKKKKTIFGDILDIPAGKDEKKEEQQ
jgi:hypothetical protein